MIDILKDAYDLHVHPAPDVVERRFDDMDLAKRYQACGMKGFAIKSHQSSTAGRAMLIQKMFPELHVLGTVTLNNAVGGLNPMAVRWRRGWERKSAGSLRWILIMNMNF